MPGTPVKKETCKTAGTHCRKQQKHWQGNGTGLSENILSVFLQEGCLFYSALPACSLLQYRNRKIK